jgi:hypothetical protein
MKLRAGSRRRSAAQAEALGRTLAVGRRTEREILTSRQR